jgi:hypothetical protein
MFERNRSQNSIQRSRVPVIVTLQSGLEQSGHVWVAVGARLADLLNGNHAFVEFSPRDGGDVLLNKQSIAQIAALEVPRNDQLARAQDTHDLDPWQVLGVEKGASAEMLKAAYHRLARAYHPDRLAGLELPGEMLTYANAMLARVNLAYRQLAGAAVRAA